MERVSDGLRSSIGGACPRKATVLALLRFVVSLIELDQVAAGVGTDAMVTGPARIGSS
jgi:hypothetical protein